MLLAASLIDDIYHGAMDPSRWASAILQLCDALGATCAALLAFDPSTGRVLRDEGYRTPLDGLDGYREWVGHDLRFEPALPKPALIPFGEPALMPLREWRSSGIYNEFLKPRDCAYFLCSWLHKTPTRMVALSFQAAADHGPFGDDEHRLLQPYLSHLARSVELRDRLEMNSVRADTLASSLERASFGLMILDDAGRILEANPAAQQLLRDDGSVFRDQGGSLRLRGNADVALQRALAQPQAPAGLTLRVERPLRPTITLMLTAVPDRVPLWLGTAPRWVAMFFDPGQSMTLSHTRLAMELGISEREAQVAALLVDDLELKQIAERLKITIHTARGHLKSIFSKTGVRSQAELVGRIARGPSGLMRN